MNDIEILEKIFTCNENELPEILKEKQNWINNIFYIGGYESDLDGMVFDSLLEGNLIFKNCQIIDEHFDEQETAKLNELIEGFGVMDLSSNMEYDCDFFIEYDFNKMERSMYQDLYPNFYHKMPFDKLNINKDHIERSVIDIFKALIIGLKDESRIIIWKDKLENMCYHCPVMSKIYYKSSISAESLIKLSQIARKNKVEVEEIYGC